jgi:signal transduction histidine kinase
MKNLVDSLLELARLESEQSFIKFQNVNVTKLVSDIKKRFISSAKKYNRKVSFKITNESLWCDGNPVKLTQAFENLLKNSIMHGNPEGEIIIKLQKQNDIFFSVYNDAPPIPNEEIPLIFERFYKLDRSRNRQIGGTGLGLSIVKNIILKHGGKVGVKNEGNGVKFWISLPIKMIR